MVCASGSNEIVKGLSKYTANDTINGNGDLKGYKIGILTADEMTFAGTTYYTEPYSFKNYIADNNMHENGFWLLTPYSFRNNNNNNNTNYARILAGVTDFGVSNANASNRALRPAIALISNIKITNNNQNGTIDNPYIIDET